MSIATRLDRLYGAEIGADTLARLEAALDRFARSRPNRTTGRRGSDQRDAVLITYGDSVLDDDRPPLRVLDEVASRHLAGIVSTIHILPFFPYTSDYGFSITDYLTVDPSLGSWDDVARLHGRFQLMFDVVLNHVSAESAWFQAFLRGEPPYDEFFITVDPSLDLSTVTRPRTTPLLTEFQTAGGQRWVWTTFSADQVDLNYANPAVLLQMVEVILGYVQRGADLLRMDAVGYLWKEVETSCIHHPKTHEVVKLFRDVLDAVAPEVTIVTETNVPHADNVSYFGDGHDEAQMVYQFPLAPLVLDALARGDTGHLTAWASTLATPSESTTFFNFLASHDGVGMVPARGILSDAAVGGLVDRTLAHGGQVSFKANPDGSESPYELNATFFDLLSDPNDSAEAMSTKIDRFICSQAIMLALAGVPGIYIHSLFGSHNDHALYSQTGWKRDLNHAHLRLDDLHARLADPSTETARVFARYSRLLAVRREQPAFHPNAPQRVLELGPTVFALERGPRGGQTIVALNNVTGHPVTVDLAAIGGVDPSRPLVDSLNGQTVGVGPIQLQPYEVRWLVGHR